MRNNIRRISMFRIGVLIIAVLLSGCGSQAIVYSDEYVPGQDQQYWYYASPAPDYPMIDSEDGYYFINLNFLYFREKATEETAPVCNKPECLHNNDACDTYLGKGIVKTLVYYADKIYYITEDIIFGSMCDILYEFTQDGAHKQLHVLVVSRKVRNLGTPKYELSCIQQQCLNG